MGITCDKCGDELDEDYHRSRGKVLCDDCYDGGSNQGGSKSLEDEANEFYWGPKKSNRRLADEAHKFFWG